MNNGEFKKQLITRTFTLSRDVIKLVDYFPNKRSAWVISDQLIRSATSIGANLVEAQSASSKKDFINFLTHALKSGNESMYWLSLSKDLNFKMLAEINRLEKEISEVNNILGSSISTLKKG